jgi:phosphoserine phosphatase
MNASDRLPRLSSAELERMLAVTRHLAAPVELSALLAEVTETACRVLHAERGSVWLFDAEAGDLVLEVSSDVGQVRVPLGRGLAGACARGRQTLNVADCYADPRFDPSVDRASGFRTRCSLTLPLLDQQGGLVGVMQVLNKDGQTGGAFTAADQALAEALAAQCAVALARARMTAQLVEAEKLRQELELARIVQQSALPQALPEVPGYRMHATFRPAAQTGGDTYDLATIGGQLLILLADAAGHGIGPALSVVQMQAMLRMAFRLGSPLETVFREVNDRLAEVLPDGHFVTAFVGLLDPLSHRLRWISGGQSPILHHMAAEDRFVVHKATSFPMGAMPLPAPRAAVEVELAPGDLLVLLSDGIYEFEDGGGGQFGRAGVERVVRARRGAAPDEVAAALLDEVLRFAGGATQQDDVTMVLLQRLPRA